MARADLILTLIKASRQGDDIQVRKAVEALAAESAARLPSANVDKPASRSHWTEALRQQRYSARTSTIRADCVH